LTDEVILASLQDYTFPVQTVGPELLHLPLAEELDHDVAFESAS
jgi:hypothetical protein